jgi:hypothetical protein
MILVAGTFRVLLALFMAFGMGTWCCCAAAGSPAAAESGAATATLSQPMTRVHCGGSNCAALAGATDPQPAENQPAEADHCGCSHFAASVVGHEVDLQPGKASFGSFPPPLEESVEPAGLGLEASTLLDRMPPDPPGVGALLALHCTFLN